MVMPSFFKFCGALKILQPLVMACAAISSLPVAQAAPQQFIVNFKDANRPSLAVVQQRVSQATGLQVLGSYGLIQKGSFVLQLEDAGRSAAVIEAALRALPSVKFAHPDYPMKALANAPTPNDTLFSSTQADYMGPVVSSNYAAMNMQAAWGIARGSARVVVAVLDSGALFEHPELKGRYLPGYDFVRTVSDPTGTGGSRNGGSNDGDGLDTDASDPGDASPSGVCPGGFTGSSFHGTAVASVVAANTNNGLGMAGMNGSVRILPVRISGQCGVALTSDIVDGMLWSVGETVAGIPVNPSPAKVVNLSFAGGVGPLGCRDNAIVTAIAKLREKGALFVTAAGNGGGALESPASCEGSVAAGTVNSAGLKTAYSAYAPSTAGTTVLMTPSDASGSFLVASNNQNSNGTPNPNAHTVRLEAGTSFSAPMLSGLIALMLQVRPDFLPAQTVAVLKQTVKPFPPGTLLNACPSNLFGSQTACACTTSTCGDGIIAPVSALMQMRSLPGQMPVANVPFSLQAATGGVPTVLDGGLSSRSNGENAGLSYQWRQLSGPAYSLQGSSTSVLQISAQTASTATARFELTVRDDGNGVQHAAEMVVFSNGEAPAAERVLSNDTSSGDAGMGGSSGTGVSSGTSGSGGSSGGGGGALGLTFGYLMVGLILLRRQAAVKLADSTF